MSSFSCPHYDFATDRCLQLQKKCVPGRKGCVLRRTSEFLFPVEERMEPEAPAEPGEAEKKKAGRRSRSRKGSVHGEAE